MSAELARLRAELEQARVQLAGCLCAAEGTGDADKVKQGDYAWTPALQRTVELRVALEEAHAQTKDIKSDLVALGKDANEMIADKGRLRADLAEARADVQRFEAALDVSQQELAQARAERVDALNRLGAGQVEYDSLYASLLDCQTERDEAEQITAAYAEEVAEAEDDLDRQRRTIRALVVFGRAAWRSLRTLAGNQARWQMAQLGVKVNMLLISERSKTTHD
ncbi:hypothetical protein [Casimicrobium huifangae]|uniref:hypothetical protein n=1 Tax=Casimicrobium huifangae TaxID=2591109 RepID=UPI003783BCA6